MPKGLELAQEYHRILPPHVLEYLKQVRDISAEAIDRYLLGWNGWRITIPVFDREGRFAFFKLAKDPEDKTDAPKMLAMPGAHAELYGWERVLAKPERIILCEGEFDRLVLESRGLAAVTSTGGALTFRRDWAEALLEIPHVFVCFDNDVAGRIGAERVARLIPHARIVRLPEEVGQGGDVTNFFVRLGRGPDEFLRLLEAAQPLPPKEPREPTRLRPRQTTDSEVDRLKSLVRIEELVGRYVPLRPTGQNYAGRCPFHDDRIPSFVVFLQTQTFYCFGCRERGDVISFMMRQERLTFPEALDALRKLNCQNGDEDHRDN
jgi:CHC2 zinc finger/Toprim-like